jgi:hypothetical protein
MLEENKVTIGNEMEIETITSTNDHHVKLSIAG